MESEPKKRKVLILSTLFFNKVGNQSLLETIKCYEKYFDVYLITSASKKNDYYYQLEEIKNQFDCTKVIYVYQFIPNILRKIRTFVSIFKKKSTDVKVSNSFENLHYTKLNLLSYKYASIFLYNKAKQIIKKYGCDAICAYEIGAVKPVIQIKKNKLAPGAKYFAKYQGSVLGFSYKESENPDYYKKYKIDIDAYNLSNMFDMCAITNDGTNGRQVLEHFGVDLNKIICLPNGLAPSIRNANISCKIDNKHIKLFTLSRLVGWKRVYLSIQIMDKLINEYKDNRFTLKIYGHGSETEIKFLENLIIEKNLADYVKICGAVPFDEVLNVYEENDVFLSLYKDTNVTNPLLEAVSLNKIVISIKDNNLTELLKDTKSGRVFLIEEKDEVDLVDSIAILLKDVDFSTLKDTENFDLSWENRIKKEISFLMRNEEIETSKTIDNSDIFHSTNVWGGHRKLVTKNTYIQRKIA